MKKILLTALLNASALVGMQLLDSTDDMHELDPELLNLPLSPRNKELSQGVRSSPKTPVLSPRVSSLSSPRRLSLTNLLKERRSLPQRTFSSPRIERAQNQSSQPPSSPSRKRLSSSNISDSQREKAGILPSRPHKRLPVSGQEDQNDFKMVVFNARNRICSNYLVEKKAELAQVCSSGNQELIKALEQEIELLDKQVIQFATEQRDWLVDQLLS